MFPTLIVLLLTIGVSPSPVIFLIDTTKGKYNNYCYIFLLLCGLASFDSNLLFALYRFLPFRFFAFCFFAFVIMCLPKTISLQVSRKLADKTEDEIMTEVLRVFAGLDVKAVQVTYEVVRVTFASPEHFWAAKSFSGNGIFSVCGALSWGAAPLLSACTFSIFLSRKITDPWRLLSRPSMVQSSLSKIQSSHL